MIALLLAFQLSTTNCIGTPNGGMNCTTIGMSDRQDESNSGEVLGKALGELISGTGDQHIRSRVGKMLAAGDCNGAYQYALQKGRFDLARTAREFCAAAADRSETTPTIVWSVPSSSATTLTGPRKVRAKTGSGYCLDVSDSYVGTGAENSPAITSAMPRCDQLFAR